MIYKLISGQSPFDLNPGLLAVEQYKNLTDKQMFVVILVADPSKDNPIRTLSGRQRRERACTLAGYPLESDGKRLAKNAREIVEGKVKSIEDAIEEFKKNHYDIHAHNKEAFKKQMSEIREFLNQDKRYPLVKDGLVIKNDKGEEVWVTDQKGLKLASDLAKDLPDLEEALNRLEALEPEDNKFEGQTYTSLDLPDEVDGDSNLSMIDLFHQANKKKEE